MIIEIMNNRCPMHCGHCPQVIQNPEAGSERIPELYAKITKLSGVTPIVVSLNNNTSDVMPEIERLKIRDIQELIVGSVIMPIAPFHVTDLSSHSSVKGRNLQLVHLHKTAAYNTNLLNILSPLIEVFVNSTLSSLHIAFNDNSMPLERFRTNAPSMIAENKDFYQSFRSAWTFDEFRNLQKITKTAEFEAYSSEVIFCYEGRYFMFTRRVVSLTNSKTKDLDYYSNLAYRDVEKGRIFSPNELSLSITPLGVRVSHRTWDIENPYLWFTHDEIGALMMGRDFLGFCNVLRALVNKTITLDLGSVFHGKMNAELLSEIAGMRKIV